MRRIKLLSVALAALAVAFGCTPKEQAAADGPKKGLQTAVFSAEATAIGTNSATFHVDVKENDQATWYCVLTEDLTSKPEDAFAKAMGSVNVTRHILEGSHSKDTTFTGLRQGWPYRFIVSGLIANGTAYGTPAVVEFNADGDIIWSKEELAADTEIAITAEISEEGEATIAVAGAPEKYAFFLEKSDAVPAEKVPEYIIAKVAEVQSAGNFSDKINKGDKEFTATLEANVPYTAVVFGVTDNFNTTGTYNTAAVKYVTFVPAYKDYIGRWDIQRGELTDTWKIEALVEGETFSISGVEGVTELASGADPALTGYYDAESGAFLVGETQLGKWEHPSYGTAYDLMLGLFDVEGEQYYGGYGIAVFSASLTEELDKIELTPMPVKGTANGKEFDYGFFNGFGYCWQVSAGVGSYISQDEEDYSLPNTLTKNTEPEPEPEPSEDPSTDPGEVSYETWLGAWDATRGTTKDRWNIEADVEGSSYKITGIDGMNVAIAATYDAETKALKLSSQSSSQATVNPYVTQLVNGLAGMIEVNGNKAPVSGATYPVAVATLSDENTASLASAGSITISGFDDPFPIVGMCIYGVPSGASDGFVYVNEFTTFPETLTRATEGGSGEGGSEDPASPYDAWIGNYTADINGTEMPFSIAKKEEGKSLTLVLPDELYAYNVELTYDAETNQVAFANGQKVDEWMDDQQTNSTVFDYIYGIIHDASDDKYYYVTGDFSITYAEMAEDGLSFTMTGGVEVSFSDGTTDTIVGANAYGVIQEGTYAGQAFNFWAPNSSKPADYRLFFPLTFTKAAASAAPAKAPASKAFRPYRFMENRVKTADRVVRTSGKTALRSYKATGFAAADGLTLTPGAKIFAR